MNILVRRIPRTLCADAHAAGKTGRPLCGTRIDPARWESTQAEYLPLVGGCCNCEGALRRRPDPAAKPLTGACQICGLDLATHRRCRCSLLLGAKHVGGDGTRCRLCVREEGRV